MPKLSAIKIASGGMKLDAINIVDDSDKPKAYDFCSYGERRVDNRKID